MGCWLQYTLPIYIILPARRISQHNMIYDFGGCGVYDAMCVHQRGGGGRYTLVSVCIPTVNFVHML